MNTIKQKKDLMYGAERGFSLLETLVALAVLTVAVTGPMNLATVSIRSASLAHNNIIASFLAEEGMELVHARRDAMSYSGAGWLADIGDCVANDCMADATIDPSGGSAASIISPCSGACPPLKYDNVLGVYGYTLGSDSIFTRKIRINTAAPFNNSREIQATVTVTWRERFLPTDQTVTISTNLSNWK